jgi:hypothetical protein
MVFYLRVMRNSSARLGLRVKKNAEGVPLPSPEVPGEGETSSRL